MVKKLVGGAAGVVALAGDVARHLGWYLNHRAGGDPRDESPAARRRRERASD